MTNSGNHGGNTRDETHTAALFISSDKPDSVFSNQPPLSQRTVMQIDIAPTISALFNLPFPLQNQGKVISPVLERFNVNQDDHLCYLFKNTLQIQHLIDRDNDLENNDKIQQLKDNLIKALDNHEKFLKNPDDESFKNSRDFYQNFLADVQNNFLNISTTNLPVTMLFGMILFMFGLVFFQLYHEFSCDVLSILFCRPVFREWPFKPFIQIFRYDNFHLSNITSSLHQYLFFYQISRSNLGNFYALLLGVVGPISCMGSVKFLELEHIYWFWSSNIFLGSLILIFFG